MQSRKQCLIKLRVVERVVKTALFNKLVVVALLNNCAVLDNQNGVGVLNGGKSVGDDKAGLVFHKRRHGVLNLYLGARVNV